MQRDITDLITITPNKNGRFKISQSLTQEANMYHLLREMGYRTTNLNNKIIYFQRHSRGIRPLSSMNEIRYELVEMIRSTACRNTTDDALCSLFLSWFYKDQPIRKKELILHLNDALTDTEAHSFRLQTDHSYKHQHEVSTMLFTLKRWGFVETVDHTSDICKNAPLFYKRTKRDQYLIFTHYNSKRKTNNGFDCWVTTFKNEKYIGTQKPIRNECLRLSFHLEKDYGIIEQYLNR